MKKATIFITTLLIMFTFSPFLSTVNAAGNINEAHVEVVTVQSMYLPEDLEGAEEVIKMYENNGWIYKDNYVTRKVVAHDASVIVDGKEYVDEKNEGYVEIPLKNEKEAYIEEGHTVTLKPGKTTTITKFVDLDEVLEDMDKSSSGNINETAKLEAKHESDGHVAAVALKDGELPKKGRAIHCNRFNGYLGDGKYYDKSNHPVLAAKNFVQSDCDVALFWYTYCLKDYTKDTECALSPASKNGWCSTLNHVEHARAYHKHTSFFGPSK